jgi:predicted glycoside hydrolase/deacetylase ChbG (UPF0249 family)
MKTKGNTLAEIFQFNTRTSAGRKVSEYTPHEPGRYLILTADDFGITKSINEGIKIAAGLKAISGISAVTNFTESMPELKKISVSHPEIGIGVHLNITTGKPLLGREQIPSLVNSDGKFYSIEALLPKIKSVSLNDLRNELRAQILALGNQGIRLNHLSDHFGILSIYSPFYDIIIELAKEYNVPVRTPAVSSLKFPGIFPKSALKKRGYKLAIRLTLSSPFNALKMLKYSTINEMTRKIQKLDDCGISHPDLFIESFWGNPTPANLLHILENLPEGISEINFHLGTHLRQGNYPDGFDLDYIKMREAELITITSDYLKEYFKYLNIKIIRFSDISNN